MGVKGFFIFRTVAFTLTQGGRKGYNLLNCTASETMTLATFFIAIVLLGPGAVRAGTLAVNSALSGAAQEAQGSSQASPDNQKAPSQPPAASSNSKPCSSAANSASSDCKPSAKPKKKHHASSGQTKSDSGPSKTVVRNGGTGESSVAISSGEDEKQAARLKETNQLLDAADLNIKDVAVRGPNASQQETIKQIRGYMDQARAAAKSGDVDRAYNLANKANMLAADLNGH